MIERDLHDQFIAWLKKQGIPYSRDRMDKRTSNVVGDPDFRCYKNGKVAFVEFKMPKGKLSPDQVRRFDELAAAGCIVRLARSLGDAIGHLDTVFGLWLDSGQHTRPQPPPVLPLIEPKFWWTPSSSLGCNVVVARNSEGHLGAIRIAKESDIEKFPRLPRELV